MVLIQLTGLSGAGKTTLAQRVKRELEAQGFAVEVLDGDTYRKQLWPELTFSPADRQENLRRLGFLAQLLCRRGIIVLLAAINPYEAIRADLRAQCPAARTVYVRCDLPTLLRRDTKGLYARALLPDHHPDKLTNLTGVNAPYEPPVAPDLLIDTAGQSEAQCAERLTGFVLACIDTARPGEGRQRAANVRQRSSASSVESSG